ncbi:hypothetical protein CL97_gp201 [Cronobacter phage CR9]|uniref:Uncharacterized protein n=1 Tax=Cronobacter phage CR9 TaxID=1162290 RepID=M1F3N8_9CAUD|nr:hypothetical protein CL97_gp201 [Cronobacter phage CR9]AFH21085.1 hypothetical protein CR9_201 [Cronobacter phage CR9]
MTEKTYQQVFSSSNLYDSGTGSGQIDPTWLTGPSMNTDFSRWEEAKRELQRKRLADILNSNPPWKGAGMIAETDDKPKSRTRTLKFKDVTFVVSLFDATMEFFEDERMITQDELRLVRVTYPEEYEKIRKSWTHAWRELKAIEAFESD